MDNAKIKNFLILADCLNYTKAAQKIGKSQSVLSRQIASMEEEMGVILLSRTTKEVELTEAGKIARHWFQTIDVQFDIMLAQAKAAQEGYRGSLTFSAMAGLKINQNYGKIINEFMTNYPDIKIQLEAQDPEQLETRILDGRIDFIMGAADEYTSRKNLRVTVVGKARCGLAIPNDHPLADVPTERLSISDFEKDVWIMFSTPPVAQTRLMQKIDKLGINLSIVNVKDIASLDMWLQSKSCVAPLSETQVLSDTSTVFKHLKEIGFIEEAFIRNKYNENPCVPVFEKFVRSYLNNE